MRRLVKDIGSCKECPNYKDMTDSCYCSSIMDTYEFPTNAEPARYYRVLSVIYGIPKWCPLPKSQE